MQAARDKALTVRHPHTDLPYRPEVVRGWFELVTPANVNSWLESIGAPYRWLTENVADVRAPEAAAPPPAVAAAALSLRVVKHSTKPTNKRRDILTPVIELAQGKCVDPKDTPQVYAQMEALAQVEHPPLLAATPDGLKYTKNGEAAYLTRDALDKRLHPEKRRIGR